MRPGAGHATLALDLCGRGGIGHHWPWPANPVSRVFLIVFATGLGEVVLGRPRCSPSSRQSGPWARRRGSGRTAEALAGDLGRCCAVGAAVDVGLALRRGLVRLRDDLTLDCLLSKTERVRTPRPRRTRTPLMTDNAEYQPETFPRRWLPAGTELKTWEEIEPWYRQLLDRPIGSPEELEDWLFDVGELNAAVGAGGGQAVHRHDLPDRRPRARGGPPGVRPRHRAEAQAAPERDPRRSTSTRPTARACPSDRYHVFDRAQENRRALYREANIPRETELAELEQQYQKIIGAMTVHLPGPGAHPRADGPVPRRDRPRAPPGGLGAGRRPPAGRPRRARRPLRPDDRAPRRDRPRGRVPRLRRLRLPPPRAVRLRGRRGRRRSRTRSRRSSSRWPGGSRRSAARRSGSRRSAPGTSPSTRSGRPPLRPVRRTSSSWPRGPRRSSTTSTPSWAGSSPTSATHGLLDLANRKGKAPGGYQTTLEDDRLPFIFMNAVGRRRRRPDPAARGGPRLPRPGQPGRAAGRLPREPDRVLRGRLDVDGAARRPRPRASSTARTTPTARTGSCSKGSS